MKYKKIVRSFRRKLKLEAIISAAITGLNCGLVTAVVALLYARFRYQLFCLDVVVPVSLSVGLVVILSSYIAIYRPNKKKVASRIDELGLEERTITMNEFASDDSYIAKLQRDDAVYRISALQSSLMKIKVQSKQFLICISVAAIVVSLCIIPFRKSVSAETEDELQKLEYEMINILAQNMREIINSSEASSVHKEAMLQIVDDMEISFNENDTTLTKSAKISMASKKYDVLKVRIVSAKAIGTLISGYDNTKSLGTAISSMNTESCDTEYVSLLEKFGACKGESEDSYKELVDFVSEAIDTAVAASGYQPSDDSLSKGSLSEVLISFSDSIKEYPEDVIDIVNSAKEGTNSAIHEQNVVTDVVLRLQELMGTVINTLNGVEPTTAEETTEPESTTDEKESGEKESGEKESGEKESGEKESGEKESGEKESGEKESGEKESGDKNGNMQQSTTEPEKIYDPEEGKVGYDKVYDGYYQNILKDLTEKEMSDDMREIIEKYMLSLN